MVCTAFRASADTLSRTNFGSLKQMNMKTDQLYLTMASTLRIMQVNLSSNVSKTIEDLCQLCVIFEHVEKLLTLAASLHRSVDVVTEKVNSLNAVNLLSFSILTD
ncbi:hypothetical protein F3Y22_tig00110954pilonHSYRG00060 [Hibiscus syriacus]|uniref:Uncharacterized protein n=1 Tax=Hibiscus syriacus TaxID=106335 RepID=A0A6A2Z9Y7_HIBSY|nr:hypothetical protein F3Y22_tig00110954pilonHSYRG00060 [Hibiscus syriacus]